MTNPITNSVLLDSLTFKKLSDNHKLSLSEPLPQDYEIMDKEELKNRLTIFISDLLENNFEKLCNMVYRHDVSEDRFQMALQAGSMLEQAEGVAELVIERELQKVETRKAYRRKKENDDNLLSDL